MNNQSKPAKARILIVENNLRTREDNKALVEYWGYQAIVAEGQGQELLQDARHKCRQEHCHLALVDMHLIDDNDHQDNSGLDLIPHLVPTPTIIFSGSKDISDAISAIQKRGAVTFISKVEKPEKVKAALEEYLPRYSAHSREMMFAWQNHIYQKVIEDFLPGGIRNPYPDQLKDLIARLFPDARSITVEPIDFDPESHFALRQPLALLRVTETGSVHSFMVEIAPAEKVEQARRNWKGFLASMITSEIQPIHFEILWDIGGVVYPIDRDHRAFTFAAYCIEKLKEENAIDAICQSLRVFFKSWEKFYSRKQDQHQSLFAAYSEVLGRNWYFTLRTLLPKEGKAMLPTQMIGLDVPLPLSWLQKHIFVSDNDESMLPEMYRATTHGYLLADHLIVLEDGKPFAINYSRAGIGTVMQDFVALETDLIIRLSGRYDPSDFRTFYQLCISLLKSERLGEIDEIPTDLLEEGKKVLGIISSLRGLALHYCGISDFRQYLWGLLFHSLFRAGILPKTEKIAQERALMFSSMICSRLEHWGHSWPPQNWPPVALEANPYLIQLPMRGQTGGIGSKASIVDETGDRIMISQRRTGNLGHKITFLHLSDIHMGKESPENEKIYLNSLMTDLRLAFNCEKIDHLVISGDLTMRASEEEFEKAARLVQEIISKLDINLANVLLVPGNHDLDWEKSKRAYSFVYGGDFNRKTPEEKFFRVGEDYMVRTNEALYWERFTAFSQFYSQICGEPYPLDPSQQFTLITNSRDRILLMGLNSSWKIDHSISYRRRQDISMDPLANALSEVQEPKYQGWLKIAVWHHPITGEKDEGKLIDISFLDQLAVSGFHLCLHGHVHMASKETYRFDDSRGFSVIGAGSFGAPACDRPWGVPMQYNFMQLDGNTGVLSVHTRKKNQPNGAWEADALWGDRVSNPLSSYLISLPWRRNLIPITSEK